MSNPSSSPRFAAPIITSLVPSSPLPTSMSNPFSSPRSITLHHDLDGTFITITWWAFHYHVLSRPPNHVDRIVKSQANQKTVH
jgi:hypothetical protein